MRRKLSFIDFGKNNNVNVIIKSIKPSDVLKFKYEISAEGEDSECEIKLDKFGYFVIKRVGNKISKFSPSVQPI